MVGIVVLSTHCHTTQTSSQNLVPDSKTLIMPPLKLRSIGVAGQKEVHPVTNRNSTIRTIETPQVAPRVVASRVASVRQMGGMAVEWEGEGAGVDHYMAAVEDGGGWAEEAGEATGVEGEGGQVAAAEWTKECGSSAPWRGHQW